MQPVLGNGALLIDSGASLELAAGTAPGQVVRFVGAGGMLKIDQPAAFAGAIGNFAAGDMIDLPGQILTGVGINSGTLVASTATQNYRILSTSPLGGALSSGHDVHGGATISFMAQPPGVGGTPAALNVSQPGMLFWASPVGDVFQGASAMIAGAHISNWSQTDSIDITDLSSASAHLGIVQSPNLDTLTLTDGVNTTSVGLTGSFAVTAFHLSSDGHGGTLLTYGH